MYGTDNMFQDDYSIFLRLEYSFWFAAFALVLVINKRSCLKSSYLKTEELRYSFDCIRLYLQQRMFSWCSELSQQLWVCLLLKILTIMTCLFIGFLNFLLSNPVETGKMRHQTLNACSLISRGTWGFHSNRILTDVYLLVFNERTDISTFSCF